MTGPEAAEKKRELADEIMSLSAAALLLNMRFLARAVNRLPFTAGGEGYRCSASRFVYEPDTVLRRCRQNERLPVHDYFHSLLHCIFRHWHVGGQIDEILWNTACDIAVEALIMRVGADFCGNEHELEKQKVIRELSRQISPLTAERIYSYLVRQETPMTELVRIGSAFAVDDHIEWYKNRRRKYEDEEKFDVLNIGCPDEKREESGERDKGSGGDEERLGERGTLDGGDGNGSEQSQTEQEQDEALQDWLEQSRAAREEELDDMWKEISEQIESELENFSKNAGSESRYLSEMLREVNRDRCDYTAFLRRFAVTGEIMRPDPDCFDVNFYTYGLGMYGNVAFIEPLEYREAKLVRDFVIAIDTSGSVSGELVKSFVSKTCSILKSEESFFSKVNIYIIQCDTEVRELTRIGDGAEFEKYISQMEIKGLGGTDFRPVFEQVDRLAAEGAFRSLRGLIYFTDGFGEFPEKRPAYETAFAFMRSEYESSPPPDVPPWAIRLILEEDEFRYGR